MKAKVLAAVIASILLVGGGAFALTRLMGAADDEALAFVPKDASGYFNLFIRPSNSQKQALDNLLQKFPGIDSTDEAIQKITDLLDDALAEEGYSYEDDIEPWLGDQTAGFFVPGGTLEMPNFAFLIESKDDEAAIEFVEKTAEVDEVELEEKTYEGETYLMEKGAPEPLAVGVVAGFLIVGMEDAFKAAVDTHAGEDSLESSDRFTAATDPLTDDWLGLFYLDGAAFFEDFDLGEQMTPQDREAFEALGFDEQEPMAGILYARPDAVVFETSGGMPEGGKLAELTELVVEEGPVPDLPGESWAAFGVPQVGEVIDTFFGFFEGMPGFDKVQLGAMFYAQTGLRLQQDVLSWMGDLGFFVQGQNIQDIGGGAVIESTDPAKTTAFVQKIEDLIVEQGFRPEDESLGGLDGFSIQVPGVPAPIYVLGGERLVFTYGEVAAATAAGEGARLAEHEAFEEAQESVGEDFNISFYVDIDAAQTFGEAVAGFTGASNDVYEEEVKPYVDVLTHFVVAAKKEGDTAVQKLVIGVE